MAKQGAAKFRKILVIFATVGAFNLPNAKPLKDGHTLDMI